jgi:hypothetical protein
MFLAIIGVNYEGFHFLALKRKEKLKEIAFEDIFQLKASDIQVQFQYKDVSLCLETS